MNFTYVLEFRTLHTTQGDSKWQDWAHYDSQEEAVTAKQRMTHNFFTEWRVVARIRAPKKGEGK